MTESPSYDSGVVPEPNMYAVLRVTARRHSLVYLSTETVIAVTLGLLIFLQRPTWWALYLPLVILACYSSWGLLDRATNAISGERIGMRLLRPTVLSVDWLLVGVGTIGAMALFFEITRSCLGNWIH